jgi:hypothetical protein
MGARATPTSRIVTTSDQGNVAQRTAGLTEAAIQSCWIPGHPPLDCEEKFIIKNFGMWVQYMVCLIISVLWLVSSATRSATLQEAKPLKRTRGPNG